MKCPLDFPVRVRTAEGDELRGGDCLQAECAWWLGDDKLCAITALAGKLYDLETILNQMRLCLDAHL